MSVDPSALTDSSASVGDILDYASNIHWENSDEVAAFFHEVGGVVLGLLTALLIIFTLAALAVLVVQIIAQWKIFTKAGQAGWKCLIPFYSSYVQYKFSWATLFFWIDLALGVAGYLCISIGGGSVLFSILGVLASIASAVISVLAKYHLAKSFGHGAGYTVGLIFLNFTFTLMLGFSHDRYVGNSGAPAVFQDPLAPVRLDETTGL